MGGARLGVAWCSEVLRRPRSSVSGFSCSCVRWMRRFFFHCKHREAAFAASELGSGCLKPCHIKKKTFLIHWINSMHTHASHLNVFILMSSTFTPWGTWTKQHNAANYAGQKLQLMNMLNIRMGGNVSSVTLCNVYWCQMGLSILETANLLGFLGVTQNGVKKKSWIDSWCKPPF